MREQIGWSKPSTVVADGGAAVGEQPSDGPLDDPAPALTDGTFCLVRADRNYHASRRVLLVGTSEAERDTERKAVVLVLILGGLFLYTTVGRCRSPWAACSGR